MLNFHYSHLHKTDIKSWHPSAAHQETCELMKTEELI